MAAGWPEREGCGAEGLQRSQVSVCSSWNGGIGLGDLGLRKGDVIGLFIPQIFFECLHRSSRLDMY